MTIDMDNVSSIAVLFCTGFQVHYKIASIVHMNYSYIKLSNTAYLLYIGNTIQFIISICKMFCLVCILSNRMCMYNSVHGKWSVLSLHMEYEYMYLNPNLVLIYSY